MSRLIDIIKNALARLGFFEWSLGRSIFGWYYMLRRVKYNRGIESFIYSNGVVMPVNDYVLAKHNVVCPELASLVRGKSVLDIGTSFGYYALLSKMLGAREVLGIEGDEKTYERAMKIAEFVGFSGYNLLKGYFPQVYPGVYDITLAFAVSHWAYCFWPGKPEWDEIIKKFSDVTREHLFIEYIDISDDSFKKSCIRDDLEKYGIEHFLHTLKAHFTDVKRLEDVSPTRHMFLASK